MRAEESGGHFGHQFFKRIIGRTELTVLVRGFAVQPVFVAGGVRQFVKQGAVIIGLPLETISGGHTHPLAAAFTDLLDGFLARRWKQITTVGTLLDPIADKLLVSAALISLVQVRALAGWMAILIIGREFAVSGLRSIAASAGLTIRASDLGKTKMVSQVVAVSLALLGIQNPVFRPWAAFWMWVVVFFSLFSAGMYFAKFWHQIDGNIKMARRRELLLLERRRQREELRNRRALAAQARAASARAEVSN